MCVVCICEDNFREVVHNFVFVSSPLSSYHEKVTRVLKLSSQLHTQLWCIGGS